MTNNFIDELMIAKKAAVEAGNYLKNNKQSLNSIISSTEKDIKLQADISAERIIKDILIKESSFEILAEESGMSSENSFKNLWVVDPLDGTANYSRDIPLCCVSIALVSDCLPVLGVVYDFNNDHLYEGSIYTKAYLNNKEIKVSKVSSHDKGILITGLPNDTNFSSKAMSDMIKNFQSWRKVRMIGSAALAASYIASGRADLYMENKSYLWDIAAGGEALILNQNEKFQVDVRFSNSLIKA